MSTKTMTEIRQITVKDEYDLIVCGGGIAGIGAALAASRQGLKTMLIEKSTILGGLATLGLIHWYEPLCDGAGRLMTTGIAEELLLLAIAHGFDNLDNKWKNRSSEVTLGSSFDNKNCRYATFFNPAVFALSLNELIIREGIELRYDMMASYPAMEGTLCTGIITESTGGREYFPSKVVIDATGDADIAARAGIPFRTGINYLSYVAHGCTPLTMQKALETKDMVKLNDMNLFWCGSNLNGKGHPEGLRTFTGIENEERSEYIRLGQTMLLETVKAKFKNETCLYCLPGMAQFRKTRCIIGADTFSAEDGRHCNTSIGVVGDFRYPGRHFEFPMGMIFNKEYPNLLVAGRITSAEGDGWEIARVIPSAALTGQAAGVVASLVAKQQKGITELNVEEVQRILIKNNVKLHF